MKQNKLFKYIFLLAIIFLIGAHGQLRAQGNDIISFSLDGFVGVVESTGHTVDVTVPYNTPVTSMIATFQLSPGATASDWSYTTN